MKIDLQSLKQRILNGDISDEELQSLLQNNTKNEQGGFLNTLLRGYIDGYRTPNMFRTGLEALLLLVLIIGIIILCYAGKIDPMITVILFAFILGYLFGKIK